MTLIGDFTVSGDECCSFLFNSFFSYSPMDEIDA